MGCLPRFVAYPSEMENLGKIQASFALWPLRCASDALNSHSEDRLYITLSVGKINLPALIDTGANHSYISSLGLSSLHQEHITLTSVTSYLVAVANGARETVNEAVAFLASVNGRQVQISFYVLPNLTVPCLLGMDVMRALGIVIDATEGSWWFKDMPSCRAKFSKESLIGHNIDVGKSQPIIKSMITSYVFDQHKKWDNYLPELMFSLNSSLHSSTGYTPAYLNFGRELLPPNSYFGKASSDQVLKSLDNCVWSDHLNRLKEFRKTAEASLSRASARQSNYYNRQRKEATFSQGDLVLRRAHPLSSAERGFASKLAPKFERPFRISHKRSTNVKPEGTPAGLGHAAQLKVLVGTLSHLMPVGDSDKRLLTSLLFCLGEWTMTLPIQRLVLDDLSEGGKGKGVQVGSFHPDLVQEFNSNITYDDLKQQDLPQPRRPVFTSSPVHLISTTHSIQLAAKLSGDVVEAKVYQHDNKFMLNHESHSRKQ
ncbi:unnamed protein product [Nezara viridula]|uniref:Peptidase A2 domain-containing protein n=1 Tax=Nezara viridula TaxID=85310 RepID=A0A9P0EF24_NEZVI|nr:unnamed protein product [Nezara viridula]